jgi:hypothetical protein
MSEWVPDIAARTVDKGAPPAPPIAYSATNPRDEATTDAQAATAAAIRIEVEVLRRMTIISRKKNHPAMTVRMPMLTMLRPRAERPPSANSRAWTITTTDRTTTPSQGPMRIAVSAPPRRCPLMPATTGKLSI